MPGVVSKVSAEGSTRARALSVPVGQAMTPLVAVGIAVFVCGIVFTLVVAASLLAALVFRFAPAVQGTALALTTSDIARMLRQMPTYPAWWHRHGVPPPTPIFGILALNPVGGQAEYMFAINPMHQLVFTTDRSQARRVDCADRFLIEKLLRMAADDGLNVFLVLAEGQASRNAVATEVRRRPRASRNFGPVVAPQLGTLPLRVPASSPLPRSFSVGSRG